MTSIQEPTAEEFQRGIRLFTYMRNSTMKHQKQFKLEVIKKVLENPKNPMNYDTLYEDFKHQHLKEKSDTVNALDV